MAILQSVAITSASPSAITVTAGSLLVYVGGGSATAITDDKGNTWTLDKSQTQSDSGNVAILSAPNCAAGATSLTITAGGTPAGWFLEMSGMATSSPVDVSDSDLEDTIFAPTASPSGLTIAAGSVAVFGYQFDRDPNASGPSGYTTHKNANGMGYQGYQTFSSGTSGERAAITTDPTHYAAVIVAYKAGAPSGATAVTLSGPSSGTTGVASTDFTVGVDTTPITGTLIVTPTTSLSGTFTPTTVSLTTGSPSATFTFTPSIGGVHQINCTNDGGLSAPSNVAYTALSQYAYPVADVDVAAWLAAGNSETVRNLLTYTEAFDNAVWTKTRCTVTADGATDPNSVPNADILVEDSTASDTHNILRTVTLANNLDYTFSAYVKPNGRNWVQLEARDNNGNTRYAYFNVLAGTVGTTQASTTASIAAAGNGYYRCAITYNSSSGAISPFVVIFAASADNGNVFNGTGASALNVWGAQLEQASSVSTYQPILAVDPPAPTLPVYPVLADGSTGTAVDTTYAFALVPGSTLKVTLTSITDPNSSNGHVLSVRCYSPESRSIQFDLYAPTYGIIATETVATTSGVAQTDLTLNATQTDNIPTADYGTGIQVWMTGIA